MTDIYGCICRECKSWHSHIFPNEKGEMVCVNCKYKKDKVIKNGQQKL
tara:strand:+ start:379 stop:522 length:144 start_codon:yes stop_codon:yes gene_type:complete